jgi:hypothetical protein
MRSLFIFVNAERADQYLNSLVYCVLKCDVREITFVHIKGLTSSTHGVDGLSGRVMGKVQAQLEALAEGEYPITSGARTGQRLSLQNEYGERAREVRAYYARCRELPIMYKNDEVPYAELRSYLRGIARSSKAAFVDVTAIRKRYLGDLVAAGLVEGLKGLHTFDLTNKPNFEEPWKMLFHELDTDDQPAFAYTNILDTEVYKSCLKAVLVRTPAFKVGFGVSVIVIVLAAVLFTILGTGSKATQAFFALTSAASLVSLALVFWPPRP